MRHLVGFFLPLCIFSFIAFGISVAVLGTTPASTDSETAVQMIDGTYAQITEDFSRIELDTGLAGANIKIYPTDKDFTVIQTSGGMNDAVSYSVDGGTLRLGISVNFSIDGIWDWISGGFNQWVNVFVPEKQYDSIDTVVSAGSVEINGVRITDVNLQLNAGDLTFANPAGHSTQALNISLNAGSCTLYNANTDRYDIEMNAGNIDVYGLTGSGFLEVNAGNGVFNLDALDGDMDIDASAGNVEINLPENSSAVIHCDKSAGNVDIRYDGSSRSLDDGEEYAIGDGRYEIYAEISAGNISITDRVKQRTAPSAASAPIDFGSASSVVTTATYAAELEPTVVEAEGAVELADVAQYLADVAQYIEELEDVAAVGGVEYIE